MPVFISHKREDTEMCLRIAQYLKQREIVVYLDALDAGLQTTDDITARLMDCINRSTHLLSVVSSYTAASWWVPFEIGVASMSNRRITTFELERVLLPDFLSKWPILKSGDDLKDFADVYKLDVPTKAEARSSVGTAADANRFHGALKNVLREQHAARSA
jgi:hypothetical protein